jgi:peptidoglycan/LPS O-acetylase OafA/YrhL
MSPAERAGRAAGLDGLRGLAALCVFLVHIWIYSGGTRPVRDNVWD